QCRFPLSRFYRERRKGGDRLPSGCRRTASTTTPRKQNVKPEYVRRIESGRDRNLRSTDLLAQPGVGRLGLLRPLLGDALQVGLGALHHLKRPRDLPDALLLGD